MVGSEQPGERLILVHESLFRQLVEQSQVATGKTLHIDMGKPHIDAALWYEPTVSQNEPHPDQLTLAEAAG